MGDIKSMNFYDIGNAHLFLRVNCNYYLAITESLINQENAFGTNFSSSVERHLVQKKAFDKLNSGDVVSRRKIKAINYSRLTGQAKYYFFRQDNFVVLVPVSLVTPPPSEGTALLNSPTVKNLLTMAHLNTLNYKEFKKDTLLKCLAESDIDFKVALKHLANYLFCDLYSFWIHNPKTETFTKVFSTNNSNDNYIPKLDDDGLHMFLQSDREFLSETRTIGHIKPEFIGIKTVNKIRVPLDSTRIGVFTLYSKRSNFNLSEGKQKLARGFIKTKFISRKGYERDAVLSISKIFSSYDSNLQKLLEILVEKIKKELNYEACSIFLVNEAGTNLKLRAFVDSRHVKATQPEPEIQYDFTQITKEQLDEAPLIIQVLQKKKAVWEYNMQNQYALPDVFNLNVLAKKPNWIGIPVVSAKEESKSVGVISVKGRKPINDTTKESEPLRVFDFIYLERVANSLADIVYTHRTLKHVQKKNSNMKNLQKTFLHEVRTPVQFLATSRPIINRWLNEVPLSSEQSGYLQKIKEKIRDLDAVATRLQYVVDSYAVNDLRPKNLQRTSRKLDLYHDVIRPVLSFAKGYFIDNYFVSIFSPYRNLSRRTIYGDKDLLGLIFHAILDNAGKYSDYNATVIVDGHYNYKTDFFHLVIKSVNSEYPIMDDEIEIIFEENTRGRNAKASTQHGTGIGLSLAKKIMKFHGGNIKLTSWGHETIFEIIIPTKKEQIPDTI